MRIISETLIALNRIFLELPDLITDLISVHLLTETKDDVQQLNDLNLNFEVTPVIVPSDYSTKNDTKLKARALQYQIEQIAHEYRDLSQLYLIHFDSESKVDKTGIFSIINSVLQNPNELILQGPIIYPNHWFQSGLLSRQMESLRPWNCYECYSRTKSGMPYHLHGSNIVVRADIEYEIGWDFGQVHGFPVVAEDLFFGIKAYLQYGTTIFGWHGGMMLEQPALRLIDSIKQRERWIKGTLQALSVVPTWQEYQSHDISEKRSFKLRLWFKLSFYAIGFLPSLFLIFTLLVGSITVIGNIITMGIVSNFSHFVTYSFTDHIMPMIPLWMMNISMFGAVLWLITIQIGLYQNIKPLDLNIWQRLREHFSVLLITPVATVFDTGIVFFTIIGWLLGRRNATWEVTPKTEKDASNQSSLFS